MLDRPIREIMSTEVHTAERDELLFEVTNRMARHNIGAVVVTERGEPVGVFSERDLLKRVVYRDISPHSCYVGEVMTPKVQAASPEQTVHEVTEAMKLYRHRHLPVMEEGRLVGIVSMRDLLAAYVEAYEQVTAE